MNNPCDKNRIPFSRSFHQRLLSFNNLDNLGFKEWLFHPAMLFGSDEKWWGDMGKREGSHEGLDLCCYRTCKEQISYLDESLNVPVMFKGRLEKVVNDFLGKSLFISHNDHYIEGRQLYTIYGHMLPYREIRPGAILNEGDIVGNIAPAKKTGACPHLHISVALISKAIRPGALNWEIISDISRVTPIDPLRAIDLPYSISPDISKPETY